MSTDLQILHHMLEREPDITVQAFTALVLQHERRVFDLIAEHWRPLKRVAKALARDGWLSDEQAVAALGEDFPNVFMSEA